jgi:uncharacterized protein YigA (DUF484 family)
MGPSPEALLREIDAGQVRAFLRAHPHFLAENPELYRVLVPPARVHGAALADHMAAMLNAERAHATAMAEQADLVLAAGRATAGIAARVQEAVLALMQASSLVDCIAHECPALLAVDAMSLCIEADRPGLRRLPAGMVGGLLGGARVVFETDRAHAGLLHGEAMLLARHAALVLVPGDGPPCLLALASRDAAMLDPAQGTGALAFLGRAVAAALAR